MLFFESRATYGLGGVAGRWAESYGLTRPSHVRVTLGCGMYAYVQPDVRTVSPVRILVGGEGLVMRVHIFSPDVFKTVIHPVLTDSIIIHIQIHTCPWVFYNTATWAIEETAVAT
jgi:hypothetical protein